MSEQIAHYQEQNGGMPESLANPAVIDFEEQQHLAVDELYFADPSMTLEKKAEMHENIRLAAEKARKEEAHHTGRFNRPGAEEHHIPVHAAQSSDQEIKLHML